MANLDAALGKVSRSKNYKKDSFRINGTYFSLSSALDGTDKSEIATELAKFQKKAIPQFTIPRNELMANFNNDPTKVDSFLFLLMRLHRTSEKPIFRANNDNGVWEMEVLVDLDNIIYDLLGTYASHGFTAIGLDFL